MAKTHLKPISSTAWARIQAVCRVSFRPCFFERSSPPPAEPEELPTHGPEPHDARPYKERTHPTNVTDEGFVIIDGFNNVPKRALEECMPPPAKRRKLDHRRIGEYHGPARIPSTLDGTTTTYAPPSAPTQGERGEREPLSLITIDWLEAAFDSQTLMSTIEEGRQCMTREQREATILEVLEQRQSELCSIEANLHLLTTLYECKERMLDREQQDIDRDNQLPTSFRSRECRKQAKSLSRLWRDCMHIMKKRSVKLRCIAIWERRLRVVRAESQLGELKAELGLLVRDIAAPTVDGQGRCVNWLDLLD